MRDIHAAGPWLKAAAAVLLLAFILAAALVGWRMVRGARTQYSDQGAHTYHPEALFGADALDMPRTPERLPSGRPSSSYWQNRADYTIDAKLDDVKGVLSARDEISYTNNSPDTLPFVWIQLDQNLYRSDSRGSLSTEGAYARPMRVTDGVQLAGVYLETAQGLQALPYRVDDTNMRVDLPNAIPAHGGNVHLVVDYSFEISTTYYGEWTRMGRSVPESLFSVGQWYPRMVVYDDLRGWETLPYLGTGEFFLEYGDIRYSIDVPAGYVVGGSGKLLNPQEVLTAEERQRLAAAAAGDQIVHIRTADEASHGTDRPAGKGRLVWRFEIDDARDAAWGASPSYAWDAVRIRLPGGRQSLAMAFYPASVAAVPDGWSKAAGYLKQDLEYYSAHYTPYPYPQAVAIAGPTIGMEYPGCVFLNSTSKGDPLLSALLHEIGHSWFPIVIGSNERRYAWMDEGLNTFMQYRALAVFANRHDGALGRGRAEMLTKDMQEFTAPLMAAPDRVTDSQVRALFYEKTVYALALLREYVLDEATFDRAFKDYMTVWAYKHPSPYDFFRFFDNETGEDLDWFWREWFMENWQLDEAVTDIAYVQGNPAKGALITIENLAEMAMPTDVAVETCDGKKQRIHLPVEIWSKGASWTFRMDTQSRIKSATVDPDGLLPDIDRGNNTLKGHCF